MQLLSWNVSSGFSVKDNLNFLFVGVLSLQVWKSVIIQNNCKWQHYCYLPEKYRYVPFKTLKKASTKNINTSTTFFMEFESVWWLFWRLGMGTDISLKTWSLCYYRKKRTWQWWLAIEFDQCAIIIQAAWTIIIQCCWWKVVYQVLIWHSILSSLLYVAFWLFNWHTCIYPWLWACANI